MANSNPNGGSPQPLPLSKQLFRRGICLAIVAFIAAASPALPLLATTPGSERLISTESIAAIGEVGPLQLRPATITGDLQTAGGGVCPGPLIATHTNANFEGGQFVIQLGFAEGEIMAASYTLSPDDFPVTIRSVEAVFAQAATVVPTVTRYSFIIWDGLPSNGIAVAEFSSDDVQISHLRMAASSVPQGSNVRIEIDPSDPDQVVILDDAGTHTFSVGWRIDEHSSAPSDPCFPPQADRNAFPTTDASGVASLTGNWLRSLSNCPLSCPGGWRNFSQIPAVCRPTGDWVIRTTYTCNAVVATGACCRNDQTCLDDVAEPICVQLDGQFMGADAVCSSLTCPEPTGSCCVSGQCLTALTPSLCAKVAGIFVGVDSSCISSTCNPGACCLPNGDCRDVISSQCATLGGVFRSRDDCVTNECPQPVGACCVGAGRVCVGQQSREACQAVGEWLGPESLCIAGACRPIVCPAATIQQTSPASGTVDARQPHPIDDASPDSLTGIGTLQEPIRITLSAVAAPGECFELCETKFDPQAGPNLIDFVDELTPGVYRIILLRPISPGAITTISYNNGPFVQFVSHPGNVNGDGATSALDILKLIDLLNNVQVPAFGRYSADVNRSGESGPPDILRLIDLLNGAGAFSVWNGTLMPVLTGCP